ncbi:sperm-egg fusion protein TMEM95 [Pyxicephalus adspersus]|uniref:Transmembrane protein 95 n=1 Tax=Pyxicephalus adspersus TaxID=30357 RepID=A0AAV3B2N9_PYXAD|nr:TPA: hypothetical protein GDO54_005681 [Pyxicephalus adspersus]
MDRMWLLQFLSFILLLLSCSGCVFCTHPEKNLKERFNKLCQEYKEATNTTSCTRYPGPNNFNQFWLDEDDVFTITEKTHRVFRVLEITRDHFRISAYWDWLHEVKLVEYMKSALCPPLCTDTRIVYNCSVCQLQRTGCLREEICYPVTPAEAMWNIVICSTLFIALGIIVFTVEYWRAEKTE